MEKSISKLNAKVKWVGEEDISNKDEGKPGYAARRKRAWSVAFGSNQDAMVAKDMEGPDGIPEDEFVAERVEVVVQKSHVTLGIIVGWYPTAA